MRRPAPRKRAATKTTVTPKASPRHDRVIRSSTLVQRAQVEARAATRGGVGLTPKKPRPEERQMSQEERLEEAALTEAKNIQEFMARQDWDQTAKLKSQNRLQKKRYSGPRIRWVSTTRDVLVDSELLIGNQVGCLNFIELIGCDLPPAFRSGPGRNDSASLLSQQQANPVQHVYHEQQLEPKPLSPGDDVATDAADSWWLGPWSVQTQPHESPAGKSNNKSLVVVIEPQSCTPTRGAGIDVPSGDETPALEVISDDASSPRLQEADNSVSHEAAKRPRTEGTGKMTQKAPAEAGQAIIHKSHTTTCTRGLTWCAVCGNFASTRQRIDRGTTASSQKLTEPCTLQASGQGSIYLSRLLDGYLPKPNMARWPDGTPAERSTSAQKRR